MQEPFWEAFYRRDDVTAFSDSPNPTLVAYEELLDRQAPVLDAGCGEGQNALYLARRGFTAVRAFDLSQNAVDKVRRCCTAEELQMDVFADDLTRFRFDREYGLVMCFGTMHFVPRHAWKQFIAEAKANTRIGGIHIMQIFTDTVPITEDLAPFAVGMAKEGELAAQYQDWEILECRAYVFDDQHDHLPLHQHAANKLVARRLR